MGCCDWFFVTMVAIFIAFGPFTCGYSIAATNGIHNFNGFLEYFDLGNSSGNASCTDSSEIDTYGHFILGTIVSFITLGGGIGSLLAAKPVDLFGRKQTMILSTVLVVLGTAVQSSAVEGVVWMFAIGRLVAGIGYGAYYLAGPLYIVEVSPKQIRGVLASFIGPGITLGLMVGHMSNTLLFDKPFGWRISRLSILFLAIILLIGLLFLPNTPRWLMLKGRESEAEEVLRGRLFRGNQEGMIEEIKDTLHSGKPGFVHEVKALLKWNNLKRLLPCIPLNSFIAACGTALIYYSETLFCSLGMSPFLVSIVSSGLTLVGTVLTTVFIDKVGRKLLLVAGGFSLSVIAAAAGSLVYVFKLDDEFHPVVNYIVVCLVCLFLLIYAATWYVIPWIVTNEVFPLEGRGVSTAMSVCMNWFTIYLTTQIFPFLLDYLGLFGTIYLFAGINLCAALFYLFMFPETKGISLEAMEKLFAKPWHERIGLCQCSKTTKRKLKTSSIDYSENKPVVKLNGVIGYSAEEIKEWEDYWEHYAAESKVQGLETTV